MNRAVIPLLLIALSGCRAVGLDYARPQNAARELVSRSAAKRRRGLRSIFNDASLSQLAQRRGGRHPDLSSPPARACSSRLCWA